MQSAKKIRQRIPRRPRCPYPVPQLLEITHQPRLFPGRQVGAPRLNEHEIPGVLEAAVEAGASRAGFTVIRLPYGVKDVFAAWLEAHFPEAKEKILNRIRSLRGGKLNDSRFGTRFGGEGLWAEQIARLFEVSSARFGLDQPGVPLSTASFRNPADQQMRLF